MAVRIRLRRTGRKNAPSYRIVAIDSRRKREGRALEILGHFNPSHHPPTFSVKKERIDYWLSVGAQMSDAVRKLMAGEYKYKKYKENKKRRQGTENGK